MTYTYEPLEIRDGGKNQMRFELGDTAVEQGALGCALSDQEYLAFLGEETRSKQQWLQAKLSLVKVVLHKFAFQVDTKIDVLEYDFSARVTAWKSLCEDLEKEVANSCGFPILTGGLEDSTPYFWEGMMSDSATGLNGIGRS